MSIIFLVIFALLGCSEARTAEASEVHHLDKGAVEGKTYKNAFLGLELTPASNLKFKAPELKGKAGTVHPSLLVAAWGKSTSDSSTEGTAFWAADLTSYPVDERSSEACMRSIVDEKVKDGLQVQRSTQADLDGLPFARTDFLLPAERQSEFSVKVGIRHRWPETRGRAAYQAVFVKACSTVALGFVFTGSSRAAVEKLIAATELKLDSSAAGCSSR